MCWCSAPDSNQGRESWPTSVEPITCKKIGIALAIIFSLCALAVLAVGVTGYLHPESLNHLSKTYSITMIIVGSATLFLSIAGIGTLLYLNTHRKEEGEILLPREPNPLTQEDWGQRLNLKRGHPDRAPYYNLINPDEKITPASCNGNKALPTYANYPYDWSLPNSAFGVRLPESQLQGFPQGIQDLFKDNSNVELFFSIIYDNQDTTTRRNLVLHYMAFPTYNPEGQPYGYEQRCTAKVGLFAPRGIECANEKGSLPIDKGLGEFLVWMHKTTPQGFGTSPNNCIFEIQPEVSTCSFYTAAQFEGRSVAVYTLLIRAENSKETSLIQEAMEKECLTASIEVLSQEDSHCAEEVKKLFAYYPNL